MKIKILVSIIIIGVIIVSKSVKNNLNYYKDTKPKADMQTFFTGEIKGWGLIQDWRGRVVTRFDVYMVGVWEGNVGKVDEEFRYYDGKVQKRVWTFTKKEDGSYTGTAGDILGVARGNQDGYAINWSYAMDVPVNDTTYRLKFDDWMWQMNDGVMINRSYFKKFGITVSELTLFLQKK